MSITPADYDLVEAETLAAHLLRHTVVVRDRHAELEAAIALEVQATTEAKRQSAVLRAEIEQYRSWVEGNDEGGGCAYRMSKAIHDEQEQRAILEEELRTLRERLAQASTALTRLHELDRNTPHVRQERAAESALTQLARLHRLTTASETSESPEQR